jgi:hypothetical protein
MALGQKLAGACQAGDAGADNCNLHVYPLSHKKTVRKSG